MVGGVAPPRRWYVDPAVRIWSVREQATARERGHDWLAQRLGADGCLRSGILVAGDRYATLLPQWPEAEVTPRWLRVIHS